MRHDARNYRGPANAFEVYLNGKLVKRCIAFDSDEGWVESYVLDQNGRIATPSPRSDELPTERRHGTVTYVDLRPQIFRDNPSLGLREVSND